VPVSESDIEKVRTAFESFEATGERNEEWFTSHFTPDGVIECVDGFPLPGSYEGVEGFMRFYEDSYGPYEDVVRRLDSIEAVGERVVALLTATGHEPGNNVELQVELGNTYELEDGRIKHLRVYVGHERTLEAARAGG
jgi:hypothetical protein